jgi:hypothetical protein
VRGSTSPYDHAVPRRRLATLAAVLAIAGLAASGCDTQSAALRVGDETVSQSELFEEMRLISQDQGYRTLLQIGDVDQSQLKGPVDGSYSQGLVGYVLGNRVTFLVADDVLADNGVEVTEADRQQVAGRLDQELPPGTKLPDRLHDSLVEGATRLNLLRSTLGDKANSALIEAEAKADVKVNSRFGRWDADSLSVVPPEGAVEAPGSGSGSGAGSSSGSGSSTG